MDDNHDLCRVCNSEATPEEPLYHPCVCRGSIKFIHQGCLQQWLKYSRKKYCEICNHRFSFIPIYSPDMPERLPITDIVSWLLRSVGNVVRFLLEFTLIISGWLGVVPLTTWRIYWCLLTQSLIPLLSLPFDILSIENIFSDCLCGWCLITWTWFAFILVVYVTAILDERVRAWLEQELDEGADNVRNPAVEFPNNNAQPNAQQAGVVEVNDIGNDHINEGVNNWNPMNWYHAAKEFIWRQFLRLYDLLMFLEITLFVVCLNTLLIIIFAHFPFLIGQFSIHLFGFKHLTSVLEFEIRVTTLFGYINIGIVLALLHGAATIIRMHEMRRLLETCCAVIKVLLVIVLDIGIIPLVCGWWLDICSLTMLGATIQDREAGFRFEHGTSMFFHWLAAMAYTLCYGFFMSLLKEVLRPGVLWFIEPNSKPFRKIIHSPILTQIRESIVELVTQGTTILLVVWLPINIIELSTPGFLPYHVRMPSDMPDSEQHPSVLLHVVLLLLVILLIGEVRQWLKYFVRTWCIGVSYILDIRSYLLGDVNIGEQHPDVAANLIEGEAQNEFQEGVLAAELQELFQPVNPPKFQPYQRPKFLPLKIVCLICFTCISLPLGSLVMITVPVFVGRKLMWLCFGNAEVYELCTIVCGLYVCWIMLQVCTHMWRWLSKGWNAVSSKIKEWLIISFKILCAMSVLMILIPILIKLLTELVLTVPFSVSLNQTPLISIWQIWTQGLFSAVAFYVCEVFDSSSQKGRIIKQIYLGGIRNIDLRLIFLDLALPVIIELGLHLSVPYIVACSIIPMFSSSFEFQTLVLRTIYPVPFAFWMTIVAIRILLRLLFLLYECIKDDKYLIGNRLVNYEGQENVATQAEESNAGAS